MESKPFAANIFRAFDIRGIYPQELDEDIAEKTGYEFGLWLKRNNFCSDGNAVTVGCDVRPSSPSLKFAFNQGVNKAGLDVRDVGTLSTGMLFFAIAHYGAPAGAMITASHNPKEYNGIKLAVKNAKSLTGEWGIYEIRDAVAKTKLPTEIKGLVEEDNVEAEYEQWILSHAQLAKPLKIVADCGNGATGPFVLPILEKLKCTVIPLYAVPDGTFPNHSPDPTKPEAVAELRERVVNEKADLGVALDGDGDRVVFVDEAGTPLAGDVALALFAQSELEKRPGSVVVYEVLSSRALRQTIEAAGGRAIMSKVGHSYINEVMEKERGILAGEMSGHFFFSDDYGYDDAIYATVKMAELVSRKGSLKQLHEALPHYVASPPYRPKVESDAKKFEILDAVKKQFLAKYGSQVTTLDGVRLDTEKGWGIVRVSNTAPELVLRFEAVTQKDLNEIKKVFADALKPYGVALP